MNVTVIGTGFVGVVTSAVLASFGNTVFGLDVDEKKIALLQHNTVPFYEPDLEELLAEQQASGNLTFTTDYKQAIENADVIMIAVGTPSAADGTADLKFVKMVAESISPYLKNNVVIVVKSTVPPGTLSVIDDIISPLTSASYHLASVPEFLREGSAVQDTVHPDRVVIGANSEHAFAVLSELHLPFKAPIITVKPESAQMGKYTANAYLATRITFINQIANLCEKNGADINEVIKIIGHDKRIGQHYWYPGFGYGGSCFPKDVKELAAYARSVNEEANLMVTINQLNENRIPELLNQYTELVGGWAGKKVAVLGLSFKPNTNDMREAPSTIVIPILQDKGATVVGYDPKAIPEARVMIASHPNVSFTEDISESVANADVIIALIEWPEITSFDFTSAKTSGKKQIFIDARNQHNQSQLEAAGYTYIGIGR